MKRITFLTILLALFSPTIAWAKYTANKIAPEEGIIPIQPPTGGIAGIGAIVINTLLVLAGIFAIIIIAWAGLQYITANGNASQAEKAKNMIAYALIGLIVISFSWLALRFISQTFGTNDTYQNQIPEVHY